MCLWIINDRPIWHHLEMLHDSFQSVRILIIFLVCDAVQHNRGGKRFWFETQITFSFRINVYKFEKNHSSDPLTYLVIQKPEIESLNRIWNQEERTRWEFRESFHKYLRPIEYSFRSNAKLSGRNAKLDSILWLYFLLFKCEKLVFDAFKRNEELNAIIPPKNCDKEKTHWKWRQWQFWLFHYWGFLGCLLSYWKPMRVNLSISDQRRMSHEF